MNPKTPLVCWPVWVEKFSTGSAKNARYATEWPSISSSLGRVGGLVVDTMSTLSATTDTPRIALTLV